MNACVLGQRAIEGIRGSGGLQLERQEEEGNRNPADDNSLRITPYTSIQVLLRRSPGFMSIDPHMPRSI